MNKQKTEKQTIVMAAFGTSVKQAQEAFEAIDATVCETYPNHDVRWVFTSDFIIKKLRKSGQTTLFKRKVPIINLEELYTDLKKSGVTQATVQSLHIAPGAEYHDVLNLPTQGISVRYGRPLLHDDKSIAQAATILAKKFGTADEVTILCGHGNGHTPKYNAELVQLDAYVQAHYPHTFLATVEGQPGFKKPLADAKATGLKKVCFVPVMITAGDHIMNDVMGSEPDSFKSILNMEARSTGGLGLNPKIIALYLERLNDALMSTP